MLYRLWLYVSCPYNDVDLAWLARITLAEDTLLTDLTQVGVTSMHGIIHLKGRVPTRCDKARIEADIHRALCTADLPYVGLVNALRTH